MWWGSVANLRILEIYLPISKFNSEGPRSQGPDFGLCRKILPLKIFRNAGKMIFDLSIRYYLCEIKGVILACFRQDGKELVLIELIMLTQRKIIRNIIFDNYGHFDFFQLYFLHVSFFTTSTKNTFARLNLFLSARIINDFEM